MRGFLRFWWRPLSWYRLWTWLRGLKLWAALRLSLYTANPTDGSHLQCSHTLSALSFCPSLPPCSPWKPDVIIFVFPQIHGSRAEVVWWQWRSVVPKTQLHTSLERLMSLKEKEGANWGNCAVVITPEGRTPPWFASHLLCARCTSTTSVCVCVFVHLCAGKVSDQHPITVREHKQTCHRTTSQKTPVWWHPGEWPRSEETNFLKGAGRLSG